MTKGMSSSILAVVFAVLAAKAGAQWLVESQNMPGQVFSYTPGSNPIEGILDDQGSRFIFHSPGLTAALDTISFESIDYPDYYLRHYGSLMFLEHKNNHRNPDMFQADATFRLHTNKIQGYYSFESVNIGGFLRHKDGKLSVAAEEGDDFWPSASFRLKHPHVIIQPMDQSLCNNVPKQCRLGKNSDNKTSLVTQGMVVNIVQPAPIGKSLTVAFQVYDAPEYYLREYGSFAYFDSATSDRGRSTFTQDCAFNMEPSSEVQTYMLIQSNKNPGNYLKMSGAFVKIDSQLSEQASSFRITEGPIYLESQNYPKHYFAVDGNMEINVATAPQRYLITYPGLTMDTGTVSLEQYDMPGYYLRHFDYNLDLESTTDPRSAELFTQDATYIKQRSRYVQDHSISLESKNYRDYWLRHQNARVKLGQPSDDDSAFPGDVTYYIVPAPYDAASNLPQEPPVSSNTGLIVGCVFGILGFFVLIVLVSLFVEKKFALITTARMRMQNKEAGKGDIENPTYEGDLNTGGAAASKKPARAENIYDEPSSAPQPKPSAPPTDSKSSSGPGITFRKLTRSVSSSFENVKSTLMRSKSTEEGIEKRIVVPDPLDLKTDDFQPDPTSHFPEDAIQTKASTSPSEGLFYDRGLGTTGSSRPMPDYTRNSSVFSDPSNTLVATDNGFRRTESIVAEAASGDPVYSAVRKSSLKRSDTASPTKKEVSFLGEEEKEREEEGENGL